MDEEKAGKIGRAFALGYVYGHGVLMAQDEAQWITVHPNGKGANANGDPIKGRPVLIDSDTGEILGGAGGKFTGRHISAMPKGGKHEQPGAQMVINRASLKKEHPEMFAPKQNKSAGSRSDKKGKTSAAASASSYKEAAERVKQIQEQQKDIDRQIHSLVSTVDWNDSDAPEAKQALSQIAKLRSDYAKLNDDLGSAIKERAALEKTTDHPNFTHATTGRNESEITSGTWEREQARRHTHLMTNTFGASGSASKPEKPHHNNPALAGSGPFAAMARKFARENPEKFAEAQKQRDQPGKNPTIAAMRELNQLRHSAPSAGIPPASAAQPHGDAS